MKFKISQEKKKNSVDPIQTSKLNSKVDLNCNKARDKKIKLVLPKIEETQEEFKEGDRIFDEFEEGDLIFGEAEKKEENQLD